MKNCENVFAPDWCSADIKASTKSSATTNAPQHKPLLLVCERYQGPTIVERMLWNELWNELWSEFLIAGERIVERNAERIVERNVERIVKRKVERNVISL